jgi:hypothetical protein
MKAKFLKVKETYLVQDSEDWKDLRFDGHHQLVKVYRLENGELYVEVLVTAHIKWDDFERVEIMSLEKFEEKINQILDQTGHVDAKPGMADLFNEIRKSF